jgi:hypothetical protein
MWCIDVIRKLVGCIPDTIQLATGAETEINTKKVRCPRPMNVPLAMLILARYKGKRIERVLSRGQKDSTYHGKDANGGSAIQGPQRKSHSNSHPPG